MALVIAGLTFATTTLLGAVAMSGVQSSKQVNGKYRFVKIAYEGDKQPSKVEKDFLEAGLKNSRLIVDTNAQVKYAIFMTTKDVQFFAGDSPYWYSAVINKIDKNGKIINYPSGSSWQIKYIKNKRSDWETYPGDDIWLDSHVWLIHKDVSGQIIKKLIFTEDKPIKTIPILNNPGANI